MVSAFNILHSPHHWNPKRKPIGNVSIDWSHPLTNGLIFYGYVNGPYLVDLVSSRAVPINAITTWLTMTDGIGPDGPVMKYTTNTAGSDQGSLGFSPRNTPADWTLACGFRATVAPGASNGTLILFGMSDASSFPAGALYYHHSGSPPRACVVEHGYDSYVPLATTLTANTFWDWAGSYSNTDGKCDAYINGFLDAAGSVVYLGLRPSTYWTISSVTGTGSTSIEYSFFQAWDRKLNPDEQLWRAQEPYSFLRDTMSQAWTPRARATSGVAVRAALPLLGVGD
jgi:hypothetical protein